jgi:hypothetical protein
MMKFAMACMVVVAAGTTGFAQTRDPVHVAIERHAAMILRSGQVSPSPPSTNQPASPQRGWVARHKILTGTLIGLGVGVPIGIATCHYPTAEGSSCSDYTYPGNARMLGAVTIGAYGAGIGALVAAVAR